MSQLAGHYPETEMKDIFQLTFSLLYLFQDVAPWTSVEHM